MMPTINHRLNGHAWNPSMLSNVLIALQRAPGAPLRMGSNLFDRVRIVIVERDEPGSDFHDDEEFEDDNDDMPEVLPPLPRFRMTAPPRLVQGEILRSEDGTLYERFGNRIRPLNQLAAGPRGEVLEVATTTTDKRPAPNLPVPAPEVETRQTMTTGTTESVPIANAPATAPVSSVAPVPPVQAIRPLFPEPGQWRVLCYCDVKKFVQTQLQHPERLREAHRLPCHVQVYEINVAQPLSAMAATILGDAARATELTLLHGGMLQPLMLLGQLPVPRPSGRTAQHDLSTILAGERVVRVVVAHDPTTALAQTTNQTAGSSLTEQPVAPVVAPPPPELKTDIPEEFLRHGTPTLSRADALLLLARPEGIGSRVGRFVRGAMPVAELRAWQIRLSGRNVDEQLWVVPPPRGWHHDASVRAWAEQTLALGRYALPSMLLEWEIFWIGRGR